MHLAAFAGHSALRCYNAVVEKTALWLFISRYLWLLCKGKYELFFSSQLGLMMLLLREVGFQLVSRSQASWFGRDWVCIEITAPVPTALRIFWEASSMRSFAEQHYINIFSCFCLYLFHPSPSPYVCLYRIKLFGVMHIKFGCFLNFSPYFLLPFYLRQITDLSNSPTNARSLVLNLLLIQQEKTNGVETAASCDLLYLFLCVQIVSQLIMTVILHHFIYIYAYI